MKIKCEYCDGDAVAVSVYGNEESVVCGMGPLRIPHCSSCFTPVSHPADPHAGFVGDFPLVPDANELKEE